MDPITVQAIVNAPIEKVWEYYNSPEHIIKWNTPSVDWHTPKATNDLKAGGKFLFRMEPKDKPEEGFDFGGEYSEVIINKSIKYTLGDGRKVQVMFDPKDENTNITVVFDPETENAPEFQKAGWQAILDNFKKYAEKQ